MWRQVADSVARLSVRVTSVARGDRPPSARCARRAARRLGAGNRPNTAEPLPDIAACDAPARRSAATIRAISGCRAATGACEIVRPVSGSRTGCGPDARDSAPASAASRASNHPYASFVLTPNAGSTSDDPRGAAVERAETAGRRARGRARCRLRGNTARRRRARRRSRAPSRVADAPAAAPSAAQRRRRVAAAAAQPRLHRNPLREIGSRRRAARRGAGRRPHRARPRATRDSSVDRTRRIVARRAGTVRARARIVSVSCSAID